MVFNPSTIWSTLSLPANLAAQGSISFVNTDNATINTDVANLWYNQLNHQLSISTGGDQTGTDSLNTYFQQDSYWPYTTSSLIAGSALNTTLTAGHTVSSSRGTGTSPSVSITGDFIGQFSAWNYMLASSVGTTYGWNSIAGINSYVSGASANSLGGELRLFTKQDGGSPTEWLTLTNTGKLKPMSQGLASLGDANQGWGKLNLNYTISASVGDQTINTPTGSFNIAAGHTNCTIQNSGVTVNSIVICQLQTNDATALYIRSTVPAAGSFVVTLGAATTGQVTVAFLVINTDS